MNQKHQANLKWFVDKDKNKKEIEAIHTIIKSALLNEKPITASMRNKMKFHFFCATEGEPWSSINIV